MPTQTIIIPIQNEAEIQTAVVMILLCYLCVINIYVGQLSEWTAEGRHEHPNTQHKTT